MKTTRQCMIGRRDEIDVIYLQCDEGSTGCGIQTWPEVGASPSEHLNIPTLSNQTQHQHQPHSVIHQAK